MSSEKRYNAVLEIIDKRLIPNEIAKKARGEVFTPLTLVREMLFGLRKSALNEGVTEVWGVDDSGQCIEDDESNRVGGISLEVWRDPSTKWLDPANGIGNFPVVAFYMLDYQLGNHGPAEFRGDAEKVFRRKHIVENMLFMIELNKGNINTSRRIFEQLVPGTSANICCADTLTMTDDKLMEVFGVNRFDVVMGNPQFNQGGTKHHSERGFYTFFITWGFNVLAKKGKLVFVHPPNFHRIYKDNPSKGLVIKALFNKNNITFLRILGNYFKDVQVLSDYYILEKTANTGDSTIVDAHNILTENIDMTLFSTVPNFGFKLIKKLELLQKIHGNFVAKIGRDSEKHTSRIQLFKEGVYPIVHLINTDGIRILLSTTKHSHQNTPKIIINGLGVPYILDDTDGKYGVSQIPIFILNPSKKEYIFLFSRLFQYLNWAFRIQGNNNDLFLFDILPDFNKLNFNTETEMYSALKLNKEDISEIFNNVYHNGFKVPEFEHVDKIEKVGEGKAPKPKTEKKPRKAAASAKGVSRRTHKRIHH